MMIAVLLSFEQAQASEMEAVVYSEYFGGSTLLFSHEWNNPAGQSWPQTFNFGASGSVRVTKVSSPTGTWRFCMEFKETSSSDAIQSCAQVGNSNESILASMDQGGFYLGMTISSFSGFTSGVSLDDDESGGGSSSSCSTSCDDGSSCSCNCSGGSCHTSCNPATCSCS